MKYQLPAGVGAISVCGVEFTGDEMGRIIVPDDGAQDIHIALQSEHLFPLRAVPDDGEEDLGSLDPVEAKRLIKNKLSGYGIKVDGRRGLDELREQYAAVMAERAAAEPAAGGSDQGASGTEDGQGGAPAGGENTGDHGGADKTDAPDQPGAEGGENAGDLTG